MRLALLLLTAALVLPAQEPVDDEAVQVLRKHGLEHSQVMDHLSWMCDVYGPRLTASPNLQKAKQWAMKTLKSWGLQNVHLDQWGPFGNGWRLDKFSMHVTGDNPWSVTCQPKAWSPGFSPAIEAEVVYVGEASREELEAMDLTGKIVFIQSTREAFEPFDGPSRRWNSEELLDMVNGRADRSTPTRRFNRAQFMRRSQVMRIVSAKNPAILCDRGSKGQYGTIFATSASVAAPEGVDRRSRPRPWSPGAKVIPQFTLAVEHYNRIVRMIKKKVPVRLEVALQTTLFTDNQMESNVIAEIPGTDPKLKDEVVMVGAHFDSWHTGTGATDNGSGSAVMMEAVRLITKLMEERGVQPRRTIRIALWTGEEQGLRGSYAYVNKHFAESDGRGKPLKSIKPGHAKLSGYYNLDNGTGRVRGVYLQGNESIASVFRAWLKPFHDLDAATLTLNNTGGTDHLAFDGVGLPGFQFIQDPVSYRTQTHHSNMDNWDHVIASDLQQASTIIASFAWHTAQRDERLPRKPMPKVKRDGN